MKRWAPAQCAVVVALGALATLAVHALVLHDRLHPADAADNVLFAVMVALLSWGIWSLRRRGVVREAEATAASLLRYQALTEAAADGTVLLDRDAGVLFVSTACLSLLGAHAETDLKEVGARTVHPDDIEAAATAWWQLLAGAERVEIAVRIRQGDGSWRWVEIVLSNHLDDPVLGAVVGHVRDVTERRAIAASVLAVLEGSARLAEATTVADVLDALCRGALDATDAVEVGVRVVDPGTQRLELAECRLSRTVEGRPLDDDNRDASDRHGQVSATALERREPVAVDRSLHLPMVASGRPVGVVRLDFDQRALPAEVVRNALLGFANQAALAIERARLVRAQADAVAAAADAASRADALREVAEALSRSLTVDEVLDAATHALDRVFRPQVVEAALLDGDGVLRTRSRAGTAGSVPAVDEAPLGVRQVMTLVAGDGRSRWFGSRPEMDEALGCGHAVPPGIEASANVALVSDGVCRGVLTMALDAPRTFEASERELHTAMASLCSEALRRAQLHHQEQDAVAGFRALSDTYERVFRNHPTPMLISDAADGTIVATNVALRRLLGYDEAALLSMVASALADPSDADAFARAERWFRGLTDRPHDESRMPELLTLRRRDASPVVVAAVGWQATTFAGRDARLQLLVDQTERLAAERERRRLEQRMLTVADDGRRRLAEQLHDGPVQHLSITLMRLSKLPSRIAQLAESATRSAGDGVEPAATLRLVEQIRRGVDAAVIDLRSTMTRLFPPAFDELNLGEAISRSLVDLRDASEDGDAQPMVVLDDELMSQPISEAKSALYRCAMEALSNSCKHASAHLISVSLRNDEGWIVLTVEDDGVGVPAEGVDLDELRRSGHLGLFTMQSRIAMLGGTWAIHRRSEAGGTVVRVALPERTVDADDVTFAGPTSVQAGRNDG